MGNKYAHALQILNARMCVVDFWYKCAKRGQTWMRNQALRTQTKALIEFDRTVRDDQ